jgi:hypothetical protein
MASFPEKRHNLTIQKLAIWGEGEKQRVVNKEE